MKDKNDLYSTYLLWKINPAAYGHALLEQVEKIISTVLRRHRALFYIRTEDYNDVLQDLRYVCFNALNHVKDPSNKRIYNYLRISIIGALKGKAKTLARNMDTAVAEDNSLKDRAVESEFLDFSGYTEEERKVALLLLDGRTKVEISNELKISRSKCYTIIDQLKKKYEERVL